MIAVNVSATSPAHLERIVEHLQSLRDLREVNILVGDCLHGRDLELEDGYFEQLSDALPSVKVAFGSIPVVG